MRLAAIASALAIALCVAVFGAILLQVSLPVPAPAPPQATPIQGRSPGSVVTVADSAAKSAVAAPVAVAPASPMRATAEAAMDLLNDLKAGGYKIVFMKPKYSVTTIASYDEQILKLTKGPGGGDARPTSSVVRTISE